jgi:hypothetical protein
MRERNGKERVATSKQVHTIVEIEADLDEQLRAKKERQRAEDWATIDRLRERNADKDPTKSWPL